LHAFRQNIIVLRVKYKFEAHQVVQPCLVNSNCYIASCHPESLLLVLLFVQLFTQVVLISLLWAPNSGGLSLMGDVAQVMVQQVQLITAGGPTAAAGGAAASDLAAVALAQGSLGSGLGSWAAASKAWLLSRLADGQSLMVLMTLLVVMPLSCQKHMRSLESAGGLGLLVILALLAVLAVGAVQAGLPAVASGQLPLWSIKVCVRGQLVGRGAWALHNMSSRGGHGESRCA
jgi:hypothetical protein